MPVSVIIPAYYAADTIADTVRGAQSLPGVPQVIVVDDGSRDGTGEVAKQAGADRVIVLPTNQGKGAALRAGVGAASGDTLLFLDADIGASAAEARALLAAHESNQEMVIAVLPSPSGTGGFGLLRGLARAAIRLLAGLQVQAPVSGQRALPAALVRHIGIAPRFGVEVGLTVEATHIGWPIVEIPLPLENRPTTRSFSGFWHRGRQFQDVLWLVLRIGYGLGWPALPGCRQTLRMAVWGVSLAVLAYFARAVSPAAGMPVMAALVASLALWLPALWLTAVWLRMRKPNYLGRQIPAAAGLIAPLVALPILWWAAPAGGARAAVITVVGVMGSVGLLDDLLGSRGQARGLRGHLLALAGGRITTGAVKALGGLAAGAAAGMMLHPGRPAEVALDALLIALTANWINLLDLRPGRALKGFAILALLALALAPDSIRLLGPVLAAALVMAPSDFAGRTMMGDVGANTLGGAAGLALGSILGVPGKLVAVVVLAALHLVCERISLTEVFARNRVLRAVDLLGTGGLPPLPTTAGSPP